MSLTNILTNVRAAEAKAGRDVGSTTVIAVSKLQPLERITSLLAAGHRHFGENRVQEAMGKWPQLREQHTDLTLHLLGPLQSNKVRAAMGLFQAIHSIDRSSLVARIARIADDLGHCPDLFIQVNTGEEPQKSGVFPVNLTELIRNVQDLQLPLVGLMCIPPIGDESALHFSLLANLAQDHDLKGLSMGMSSDYETAIHLGATHTRIGTAIFGQRNISLR
ncbi:MAG: YggS family pyridoxal phosphate-dependent enzyme [Rhodobacteraceae bacterium]|nr:YggS family pyridoxal phosphate-dependent enzyme [Paracoccaceae bacterium]